MAGWKIRYIKNKDDEKKYWTIELNISKIVYDHVIKDNTTVSTNKKEKLRLQEKP